MTMRCLRSRDESERRRQQPIRAKQGAHQMGLNGPMKDSSETDRQEKHLIDKFFDLAKGTFLKAITEFRFNRCLALMQLEVFAT